MNSFERKMQMRLRLHPEMWHSLLAVPTEENVQTIINFKLFESPNARLASTLLSYLPFWELQACEGDEVLVHFIKHLEKAQISPLPAEEKIIKSNLQRIRILAATPGMFPFSPQYIQENLLRFLESSDTIADLPEFNIVSFTREEITPLEVELVRYRLHPHSRRYVQNLMYSERREAILAVLAYIAKNYPLLGTCRQAYALMLSLDNSEIWSKHPFCLRLIANRFWEYRLEENGY